MDIYILSLAYSIGIAAVTGVVRFKTMDKSYHPFVYICCLAFVNEIISTITAHVFMNNAVNLNLYVLAEALLFVKQFYNWKEFNIRRNSYLTLNILLILVWIINEPLKKPHAERLRTAIDYAITVTKNLLLEDFISALERKSISAVLYKNRQGNIYVITYIDHQTKAVFTGSDLGKTYSAKMILERTSHKAQENLMSRALEKGESVKQERILNDSSKATSQGLNIDIPRTLMNAET